MMGLKDSNGIPIAANLMAAAGRGGGELFYAYPRPGGTEPKPKVSYAVPFKPWDWVICTGIYIDDVDAIFYATVLRFGAIFLAGLMVSGGLVLALSRNLSRGIANLTMATTNIAHGDYRTEVPETGRTDEIGVLAKAIKQLRDEVKAAEILRKENEAAKQRLEQERRETTLNLATQFEASVSAVVKTMIDSAGKVDRVSQSMRGNAETAQADAAHVSDASQEVSSNIQTVATAAEELAVSIGNISRQIGDSVTVSAGATERAQSTSQLIGGLAAAVGKIGDVVNLINDIASQTNLLALNATIEAARAGDAGKGFAVVANEVKNLATQTGKATGEIGAQVQEVQTATGQAVEAIRSIVDVIGQISSASSSIATAVEEQNAATREISRNVNEAASGAGTMSQFIERLAAITVEVKSNADAVTEASAVQRGEADRLDREVGNFLRSVRA